MAAIITWTFFFFTLILHTFQLDLKRYMLFDYNDVFQCSTESTYNTRSLKIAL